MKKLYFYYMGWFLTSVFFLASSFFAFLLAKQFYLEQVAKNMSETSGHIRMVDLVDRSNATSVRLQSRKPKWGIKISYKYWVNNIEYESDRVSFSNMTLEKFEAIKLTNNYAEKLKSKEPVRVYYSHLFPSIATLDKNVETKPKLIFAAGMIGFFLFAFAILRFNRITTKT